MSNNFTRKGYGRIYVENESDIQSVKDAIKEMDECEFDYLPDGLIAPFSEYPNVVYTGKFDDLNLDLLTAKCWTNGIKIWCLDNGRSDFVDEPYRNA